MSFINWGNERPEQIEIRRRLEEQAMFEQAARMSQARRSSSQIGAGGSSAIPFASIDWLVVAPGGSGSVDHDYANFDEWTTETFEPIADVTRLSISGQHANAHVHSGLESSNLTIELYDDFTDEWVTVWSHVLINPNYGENGDSEDFFMKRVSVSFPKISQVTRIRVSSDPGSDQSYHDWDVSSTFFNFYK